MRATCVSLILSLATVSASADKPPYVGCLAAPTEGIKRPLALNQMNWQKVKASPERCAQECQQGKSPRGDGFNNDYPLFAINDAGCFCGFHIAAGARLTLDGVCGIICSGDDSSTCGGNNAYSLYGDGQFVAPPSYVAGLTFDKCYEFDETKNNGPKYTDGTSMTVNSCANFCVGKHGKYGITLDKDNNCYCTDPNQNMGNYSGDTDYSCNHPCPGDKRQSCGGGGDRQAYVSHWTFNAASKRRVSVTG